MKQLLLLVFLLVAQLSCAQVSYLDMLNLDNKTTAEMNAITVGQGLQRGSRIYNTTTGSVWQYNGTIWEDQAPGAGGATGTDLTVAVRNSTGATISTGQAVYINGSQGNNLPTVGLAQADNLTTARSIGVVTSDILNNSNGTVTTLGIVENLDTSAFTAGDALFLSTSVAGGLTNVRPTTGFALVVGYATIINATTGEIKVISGTTVQEAVQDYNDLLNKPITTLGTDSKLTDGQGLVTTTPSLSTGWKNLSTETGNSIRGVFANTGATWNLDPNDTGDSFYYNFANASWVMPTNMILQNSTPTLSNQPASKQYVDNQVSGVVGSQTLSQVLTEGNIASTSINMDSNSISNINDATATSMNTTEFSATGVVTFDSASSTDFNGEVDFNGDFRFLPTDIEPTFPLEGDIYADNSENRPKYHNGTGFEALAFESDLGDYVDLTSAQTITGQKTFTTVPLQVDQRLELLEGGSTGSTTGYGAITSQVGSIFRFLPANETFAGRLAFPSLTAQRTYTFPDASGTVAFTSDLGDYVTLTGDQNILGNKDFSAVFSTLIKGGSYYVGGSTRTENTRRWNYGKSGDDLIFRYQNAANTSIAGSYINLYTLNNTGTPTNATDLVDKDYFDTNTVTLTTNQTIGGVKTFSSIVNFDNPVNLNSTVIITDDGGQTPTLKIEPVNSVSLFGFTSTTQGNIYFQDETTQKGLFTVAPPTGSTNNHFAFDTDANTAFRTYVLPNQGGTVALTSDLTATVDNTGTVINLDGYEQKYTVTASTATTFTTANVTAGGYAEVLINTATEPTITGATKIPNTSAWIASTDMLMVVKAFGTTVKYFFVEY